MAKFTWRAMSFCKKDGFGAEKITVYLLVLQEAYSVDGETLTEESGSYVPTAITFAVSASGEYTLEEYWEPSDGSYSDDIRAKFPADAADEALNDQAYIDDLKAACDQKGARSKKRCGELMRRQPPA